MKVKSFEKRKRIISSAIILTMMLAALPAIIGTDAAGPGDTPTLRCYGYQNFGAGDESISDPLTGATIEDPPYTDAIAPFNPQHSQAPVKDSITFNPVYLSELESDDELMGVVGAGPLLDQLKAAGQDVNEKVFLRQWYEPWHWDKDVDGDGDMYGPWYDEELLHGELQWLRYLDVHDLQELGWLDEEDEIYPAIMQDYTYMYVDALMIEDKPEPVPGYLSAGENSFLFPIGIREDPLSLNPGYQYFWSPYGYGLSGIDANFDGYPDLTYIESEKTLFEYTGGLPVHGIAADFDGNQYIDPLDWDGYQLSGDELAIFRTEQFQLVKGGRIQFLDHMIEVVDTFKNSRVIPGIMDPIPSVKVAIWYTGDLEPEFLGYQVIDMHDMALVGRKLPVTYIRSVVNGGPGTNLCDFPTGPWFIYVHNVDIDEEEAYITVGRALGHAHTAMEDGSFEQDLRHGDPWWLKRFYVDGHEYNVVAIETVGRDVSWGWDPDPAVSNTDWFGPCLPGTVYPVPNTNPCYYFNDLDAAWAGEQIPTNPDINDNEIEEPDEAIHGITTEDLTRDDTGFKFITIRTPIPKGGQRQNPTTHEIEYAYRDQGYSQQGASDSDIRSYGYYHLIEQHSIRLQPYFIYDMLSVLPPYNFEHSVLIDIQKNWSGIWDMDEQEWVSEPEWIGPLKVLIPPITQTTGSYRTLDGRTITPEYMYYVDEGINPQYKGELKEKLYEWSHCGDTAAGDLVFTGGLQTHFEQTQPPVILGGGFPNTCLNEGWYVEQWNTLPDEYTEFILPAGGPYDEDDPYLYLMTSAFADTESIGRILNQEWQDDDIADERFWRESNIDKATELGEIPPEILALFGTDLLDDPRVDRDGPFAHREEAMYSLFIYWQLLYGSAWGGSYTNGIQYIDGNRVKFWFDPAPLEPGETANDVKKYKYGDDTDTDGIRIYGRAYVGAGAFGAFDTWVNDDDPHDGVADQVGQMIGDRDGDGFPDMIEYPPYTDPMAPFNPQAWQAPTKDSLTFDPAYMNEYHNGGEILSALYKMISIEESDAREKVFFRMWYEPWHWDKDCNADGSPLGPDAIWLLDPDFQEVWWWPVPWLQGKAVPSNPDSDGYVEEYAGQSPPELYGRGGARGDPWEFLDPDDEIHPALLQEFTYMYVNPYNMPDHGQPGTSQFAFPMASKYTEELWDCFGYGLTTFDCNFDGVEDICTVHSELSLAKRTGIQADFNGDGVIQMLDADDIALNGNEIVIFAVENVNLATGESAMFLDNMVTVGTITSTSVSFEGFRTSGTTAPCIQPYELGGESNLQNMRPGEMTLVRHTEARNKIVAGGNNLGRVDGAWFIYVESIDNSVSPPRCAVTIGRALGCTWTAMDLNKNVLDNTPGDPWYMKRFYVDGHEYNVVAIMTVKEEIRDAGGWANSKEECYEFKYITIRTQVPKVPVVIEQHSVRKQEYIPCSEEEDHFISVMPPFNYDHTCKADIQEGWATTQEELEWLSDNDYKGDVIKNKPPLKIHIEEETRETQFKGELKEKYNKRPLIDLTVVGFDPAIGPVAAAPISGFVDGRAVVGAVDGMMPWTADGVNDNVANGCFRWMLSDDPTGILDRIYNQRGQDVSNMMGKFILYDWDNDGDDDWIMCVDYLTLTGTGVADVGLNEDYLCFFAVYNPDVGRFLWLPDGFEDGMGNYEGDVEYTDNWVEWESWMTEQWHTIPDLYTDVSIDQGTDDEKWQLYMLTSSWIAPESELRVPYYEDGALRLGDADTYEFFVPIELEDSFDCTIEIFLYHEHDIQNIILELLDTDGALLVASATPYVSQEVITYEPLHPGKYYVRISTAAPWSEDLEPESYELYIEVRGQGARVKFWYDPETCDDIYVNTATAPGGGCICYKGDKNMDCKIDALDLTGLADAWPPLGTYDVCFDFNDDGVINAIDLTEFADHWGETYCTCEEGCSGTWQQWP